MKRVVLLSIGAGLAVSVFGSISYKSSAQPTSFWLNSAPALQKDFELAPGTALPPSFNGNRDCTNYKFITRPAKILPELSYQACGIETQFGVVDPNGRVELNNTSVSGSLVNHPDFGSRPGLIPIPNSSTVINAQSAPSGVYLYFTKDIYPSFTPTILSTGEVTYKINKPFDGRLRDKSNKLLQAQTDSLSFSTNGKWMVVDSPNVALLRVNLETFEVLPFAPSFNYNLGIAPGLQTAISADGRYAVVASNSFPTFKIYDLSTCGAVPDNIVGPANCQAKDLQPFMNQQITNYVGLGMVRFISGDVLSLYATGRLTANAPSTNRTAKYFLSSSDQSPQKLEYLALGDSYISGEGAYEYRNGTDIDTNKCHVSLRSYPYLVAGQLNFNSFNSVACSGAEMQDILDISSKYDEDYAQSKGKFGNAFDNEIYANFQPGYRAQLNFITRNRPEVITISIGGNDIGFSDILKRCLSLDTCYGTYEDRVELVRLINKKFPELRDTYSKIKDNTSAGSKIYAVGYPQIAKPDGDCALNVRLNSQELDFARMLTSYLNSIIKLAANEAGVRYVDAENALVGSRLCETESFNVAVNGLTSGDDLPNFPNGPIGNESYHPNALGHRLLKDEVLDATQNLTLGMPAPSPSVLPAENGLEILNAAKSGRQTSQINYEKELANDFIYRQSLLSAVVSGLRYSLKPLSQFQVWINSEPKLLGTFTSGVEGDLAFQTQIPGDTPAGFHTLRVKGLNMAGEAIDIYKTVYIAVSENDLDGDGVPNDKDACLMIEPAGEDSDKDGIDDGCDGFIDKAQIASTSTSTQAISSQAQTSGSQTPEPAAEAAPINSSPIPPGAGNVAQLSLNTDDPNPEGVSTASSKESPAGGVVLGSSISKQAPWKWRSWAIAGMAALGLVAATTVFWKKKT